ncbi:MAG: TRAP transporter substrate-binding protein DctP [Pseudomonadota bacterium]
MRIRSLISAAMVSMLTAPAALAETTITYNIFTPPTHFMWDVMRDWKAQVEEKTEGRVKIEFTAKSVAPPPKIYEAVRKGAADGGFMANVFSQKFAPGTGVSMVPWVHRGDSEAASVAVSQVYNKHFLGKDKWKGVELLGVFQFAAGTVCSVDGKPLASLDDLAARKFWTLPGNTSGMFKALDIAIVSGPAVQVQELVSRNVVDAYAGITYDAIEKFGAGPYTAYCFDFEVAPVSTSFSHFISSKVWKKLSEEDRQALRDLSGDHLAAMVGAANNASQKASLATLTEAGMKQETPAADLLAALEKGAMPVEEKWLASIADYGLDGPAILTELRVLTKKLTEENAAGN